ncbi:MAG: glycoside hydrolase family 2 [Oscillospiraceae bacterium]|nr:glycoside hydrolase family 2 [Oscillospiraceae bacterium]
MDETRDVFRRLTRWGEAADLQAPLCEYPRPQFMRPDWLCLNGQWSFEICPDGEMPLRLTGAITVPFCPESMLSGAARGPRNGEMLWYGRSFSLPDGFMKDRLLLNFGAVDQWCEIFINGQLVGTHEGGYLPFSVDITEFIDPHAENRISVSAYDLTDEGPYACGRQSLSPAPGDVPAQSGIWQTVWLESVPDRYIRSVSITPDLDRGSVRVEAPGCPQLRWVLFAEGRHILNGLADSEGAAEFSVPDMRPWSPEDPFLYELVLIFGKDIVKTYFAMRKISVENGEILLNNKPVFLSGVIDSGLWSDGLYTAPSDEAMIYDISTAKKMGFNLLRKYAKVEPLRWYYHCDRLGMLVWQDIPGGGSPGSRLWTYLIPRYTPFRVRDTSGYSRFGRGSGRDRARFVTEMEQTEQVLYNSPCVICWSLFDEGRGQFDSVRLSDRLKRLDPTRLVDHASGWLDQRVGDFKSVHVYSGRIRVPKDGRVFAVTMLDGFSCPSEDEAVPSGARRGKRRAEPGKLADAIVDLYEKRVIPAKERGMSVCIYMQLTDIGEERNGLISFDRALVKAEQDVMLLLNKTLKGETT